jgi:hypothetical protein
MCLMVTLARYYVGYCIVPEIVPTLGGVGVRGVKIFKFKTMSVK